MSVKLSDSEYTKIHHWLRNNYGRPDRCENKKCEGLSTKFEWALKNDKVYGYDRNNFIELCHVCHSKYDNPNPNNGTRITIIIDADLKQEIKVKALTQRKTITQVATALLEKWLKEK